jgi:hypothetical protein
MKIRITILLSLAIILGILGCSKDVDRSPTGPVTRLRGKVAVANNSNLIITLVQYTHIRQDRQATVRLVRNLNPGFNFYLRNALDNNDSQIFEGGDRVLVHFRALESDPDDPGQPLFQNTVELIVNGSQMIHVKDGGDYGISPE